MTEKFKWYSQLCVILLIVIAAAVSVLQVMKANAWLVIISYWVVLTAKNLFDWLAIKAAEREKNDV